MTNSYRDLIVWQKSIELVQEIYRVTRELPKEEVYVLGSQMRRSAISIPSNIAEGSKRKDVPEYVQFLRIAAGSSAELETQLIIMRRAYPLIGVEKAEALLDEIQRMLTTLIQSIEKKRVL